MTTSQRQVSIMLIFKDDQISLAMKKRGFGEGLWNGYGGKIQGEETIEQATIRETFEECGTKILDMKKVGEINFYFSDKPEWNQQAIIFVSKENQWENEPRESEEMKPQWFNLSNIPYENMWPADKYWLPLVLNENLIQGEISMNSDQNLLEVIINGEKINVS